MPKILWNPSFSIGSAVLDEHHQHLAGLINRLAECATGGAHSEAFVDVLCELAQYAKYHFTHEEKLMEEHGFPRRQMHSGEHTRFCEAISDTSYEATQGCCDIEHLVCYLSDWWERHILQEDMQLKPFFAARGGN